MSVALVLCALTGCQAVRAATGGGHQPGPLVVVLFDVSRSTADPDVRARYLTTFETVLDHVAATHGTVVGDVIDDDPLAHSTFPISATFDACDPLTDNRARRAMRRPRGRGPGGRGSARRSSRGITRRRRDRHPRRAAAGAARVRRVPGGGVALARAAVRHGGALGAAERDARRADDASIASTIDGFAADGLIPDLRGVEVYVVGAGVSQGGADMPADRFLDDRAVLAGVPVAGRRRPAVGTVRRGARAVPLRNG